MLPPFLQLGFSFRYGQRSFLTYTAKLSPQEQVLLALGFIK